MKNKKNISHIMTNVIFNNAITHVFETNLLKIRLSEAISGYLEVNLKFGYNWIHFRDVDQDQDPLGSVFNASPGSGL